MFGMVDYQGAVGAIRSVLVEVRPALLQSYGKIAYSSKDDGSPVTELDVKVEKLLKERLQRVITGIGFYAEETAHDSLAATSWLVDPIDGTDAFIRGLPLCSNLVSLVEDGRVTLGVVYNFAADEFYHAIRGQGAYLNGNKIAVSDRTPESSTVIFESSSDYTQEFAYAGALTRAIPASQVAQRVMHGYDLALIAQGKADGVICKQPYEHAWDVAPGSLLIEEAGGIVRNLNADTYDVGNLDFYAGTRQLYDRLQQAQVV